MKNAFIISAMLLLVSCVTYNKCFDKFGSLEKPKKVVYSDTLNIAAPVEADSLEGSINLDTLCDQWRRYNENKLALNTLSDSFNTVSESGKLSTQHWIDKYNRLLRFKSKKEKDTVFVEKIIHDSVQCPPQNVFDPNKNLPWHREIWEHYKGLTALVLPLFVVVLMMVAKWKKITGWRPEQDED